MNSKKLYNLLITIIPPHASIMYVGCRTGEILYSLKPKKGVGIDTRADYIEIAKKQFPQYTFINSKICGVPPHETFDFIILDTILPYLDDVYCTLLHLKKFCHANTKLVMTGTSEWSMFRSTINPLKSPLTKIMNWIPPQLLYTLLHLSGFVPRQVISSCIIADVIFKKRKQLSYSIIVPAYNEEGNIKQCITRIPDLKRDYQIIIVNDGSLDKTAEKVYSLMKNNKKIKFINYEKNRGKGYATKKGMDAAEKDVIMILDADMTVMPEDLLLFIPPFEEGNAEYIQGTRMVYPMENQAMKLLNIFGNKIFSYIFSYILGQHITDTLCGTKCLLRKDYARISMKDNTWPDFDLLFGASKLKLKIAEIPIHYQRRTSGESKMLPFKHGFMLLKASFTGFIELKLKSNNDK